MAKYGTIVIIYDDDTQSDITKVETILNEYNYPYLKKESSLYFRTSSKNKRNEIAKKMRDQDITFMLFHNNNSDGDKVKVGNISVQEREEIKSFIVHQ